MSIKKRKSISLETKYKILVDSANGWPKQEIVKNHDLKSVQISTE
jgi:hypothetical protein